MRLAPSDLDHTLLPIDSDDERSRFPVRDGGPAAPPNEGVTR